MKLTKELLKTLNQVPTGNVADNNPDGYVMSHSLRPVNPSLHMIGRAFPVRCKGGDNLALHEGMAAAREGDVLIFDCEGFCEAGHFGDMMANACMVKGIAGVVINGSCRDSIDILELKFPVYAKAYCPAPTVKKAHAVMNEPMDICGAHICPGDLVFADGDGIVIIPQEKEDEVMKKALAKFAKEKEILTRIRNGESTMTIYGFDQIR